MKLKKVVALLSLTLSMIICSSTVFAASNEKVMPSDLYNALTNNSKTFNLEAENILSTVTQEPSLSITIPKIDTSKVHVAIPIGDDEGDLMIRTELQDHGYTEKEISEMDIGDYQEISATWYMNPQRIETAKIIYPELANQDLTNWTNEQYNNFIIEKNNILLAPTASQANEFEERNITLDDAIWLTKIYETYGEILEQSDQTLKNDLEKRYQFTIDNIIKQAEIQQGTRAVDTDLYIKVPAFAGYKYKDDWFLKSVSTHVDYWRGIQENRVLKAFKALYKTTSVPSTYYTTNLYGTYSVSQGGAHEGIDFAYGNGNTKIYNIMLGIVRKPEPKHASHHLCVYDSNYNKTYSYLHMNSKEVSVGTELSSLNTYVGKQGKVGNADGVHVHFEVHSGNTYTLSKENDNVLGSISPYQLQVYLGE